MEVEDVRPLELPARLAQERAIEFTLLLVVPCVAAFLVVLVSESSDAFTHIGVFNFLFHNNWETSQLQEGAQCATGNGCTFGAWPMLVGTIVTYAVASSTAIRPPAALG